MYYCSELKSMSVLSLYEGELVGIVDKLFFDKRMKKLIELEVMSENGNKLILQVENIYKIGKNAITVKNNQSLKLKIEENKLSSNPIGSKAYTINGEYLGVVQEICIDEKFKTTKINLSNDKIIDAENILSSGKNTIIFIDEKNKNNIQKKQSLFNKFFKNVEKINKNNNNYSKNIEKTQIINDFSNKNKNFNYSPDFLIGRICTKDILNFNKEVLIKSQTKITKDDLVKINKYGKLHELMLYSK